MRLQIEARRALLLASALIVAGVVLLVAAAVAYSTSPEACPAVAIIGPDGKPLNPCVDSQQIHAAWGFGLRSFGFVALITGGVALGWRLLSGPGPNLVGDG